MKTWTRTELFTKLKREDSLLSAFSVLRILLDKKFQAQSLNARKLVSLSEWLLVTIKLLLWPLPRNAKL